MVGEQPGHLRGALDVELLRVEAQALGVPHLLPGADAQEHVVGVVVVVVEVVGVVGGGERQARALPQPEEGLVDAALLLDAVVHHLEVEATLSKDVGELPHRAQRGVVLAGPEVRRDLAREAPREADEPAAVASQNLLVDPGAMVEALQVPDRDQADEVVVALGVGREKRQVVVGLGDPGAGLLEAAADRDVDLAAEDRLQSAVPARVVEGHGPEHVAVVRDREGLHPELGRVVHKLVEAARAVEEAVLGVEVEVDEVGGRRHSHSIVDGGLLLTS